MPVGHVQATTINIGYMHMSGTEPDSDLLAAQLAVASINANPAILPSATLVLKTNNYTTKADLVQKVAYEAHKTGRSCCSDNDLADSSLLITAIMSQLSSERGGHLKLLTYPHLCQP